MSSRQLAAFYLPREGAVTRLAKCGNQLECNGRALAPDELRLADNPQLHSMAA